MQAPAAKREVLVLLAGLLWSAVGIMLLLTGTGWTRPLSTTNLAVLFGGLGAGIAVFLFGFSRLAKENLKRIYSQAPGKEKVCLFAFQNTRSYILVAIMITMGYALRHSPLPKIYLAPIYLSIGLGLFLSSILYYRRLLS